MKARGVAQRPRIALLGSATLVGSDGSRLVLERKAAALLALLALDGPRRRSALAALLWPDATAAQARNSLRQRLFKLHQASGRELIRGGDELLLAPQTELDLHAWDEPLTHTALQPPPGALLEGHVYDDTPELAAWVDAARERTRRRLRERLAALAGELEQRQQLDGALAAAEQLLAADPLAECSHRRLMRLHYLRGERAQALAAFERCKALLRSELGTAPDRETLALAATIACALQAAPRPALVPMPVAVLRPPRLVGRDAAQARIAGALAARRPVVLHGEPGIGKSRLLETMAEAQAALASASAQAGDARTPYALLARLAQECSERWTARLPVWATPEIARLAPALGSAATARPDPLRMQQAFAAACTAWADAGCQGWIVDDLHHADEASLETLLAVAGSGKPARPWLLAVRTRQMPPLLQDWLAAAGPDRLEVVRLAELAEAEVRALLESLALERLDAARWSAPLARHSGGNPLFALETVRALLALGDEAPAPDAARLPVPAALDALLERRLAQLGAAALKLARIAALAGVDFDADVAAAVLEMHPLDLVEPWRELEAAQLLAHGRLSHDLVSETVRRALPAGIAQALHARLAACLEALARSAARVAPHWAAAGAWSRAGERYADAAREARRTSRRPDEVALWEEAALAFERAGEPERAFDARADSVESVILCRGIEAAAALVEQLDASQRTEPQRLRALNARANVNLMAGRAPEGEAAARLALDTAARLGTDWPRFEAARLLAVALAQTGRADEALRTIEPFKDMVTAAGSLEQRHHFWSDYAYALKAAQRVGATAEALRQAMATAQEAGDMAELATLTSNLSLVEGNLGRVEQALEHARRARALSDPLGVALGPPAGAIELYASMHEAALGRYAEALAGFERAQACFAASPGSAWLGIRANHLAHVWMQLGQFTRALQTLQWHGAEMPATQARKALLRLRIARALGQNAPQSAAQILEELGDRDPLLRLLCAIDATLALPAAQAAASCARLAAEAEHSELLAVGMRARMIGLRHRSEAGFATDEEVDDLRARLQRVQPADTYLPEAWWTIACACDRLGRSDDAQAALREGHVWVVERALPNVPPPFRAGFVEHNAVNRELLAAAGRRLGLRLPHAPHAAYTVSHSTR